MSENQNEPAENLQQPEENQNEPAEIQNKPAENSQQPVTWRLVEVDKSIIRPNASNPKTRKDKGYDQLEKITSKFGVIFDGILNADYSLIDGHSRLEMYPDGTGNYFMPSKQLSKVDETELNALFDLARAGEPDMFMIEQIMGDDFMEEWDTLSEKAQKKVKAADKLAKFPLVPQYDEKYEAILILCTNSLDTTFIKNALGIERAMSYKNKMVKETSVVTAKQFIDKWKLKS